VAAGAIALSGFPYARGVGGRFRDLVRGTRYEEMDADARLLCMHQVVEGAQVGAHNYTFRRGPHVVRGEEIPAGFCAVLSGHIHRGQTLTHDLRGKPLTSPVIYPGSVERTSFAERNEKKGYVILTIGLSGDGGGQLLEVSFEPLPARPMVMLVFEPEGLDEQAIVRRLGKRLSELDPDSVVRVELRGPGSWEALKLLSAARLRELAPPSMNVSLAPDRKRASGKSGPRGRGRKGTA
jgi:DNA repair exonuclease SbcCD nuclease subunit